MAEEVGCAGVVVDAKPGAIDFYAKYGFVPFEPLEGDSDARPRPTAMWLPIEAIKKAERASGSASGDALPAPSKGASRWRFNPFSGGFLTLICEVAR